MAGIARLLCAQGMPAYRAARLIPMHIACFALPAKRNARKRCGESGNILFMVLLAVALIGLLTMAVQRGNNPQGSNIDKETLILRAGEVQRYASELERGVLFVMEAGTLSESDIRFAHASAHTDYGNLSSDTDRRDQVFDKEGGAASYKAPPANISDGSAWEFYGGTAVPQAGSDRADLVAVLPNVTQDFCEQLNALSGYSDNTQPLDTGACVYQGATGRFNAGNQFEASPNTMDEGSFSKLPALQGCVRCDDGNFHFFHVLYAR